MKPNDREYIISTGDSRMSKQWRQKKCSWAKFVERCKDTKRTRETVAQYADMTPDERGRIKDIGGFVAGVLNGTRRTKEAVISRCMIALDIDNITTTTEQIWQSISNKLDFALLVYSSHSHTPEKPRLRLVIPTSRDMVPDEYEPIARRITSLLGIEQFDQSTYEIGRLMYWPSTPIDGDFYFNSKKGELCDPEAILSSYEDWRNVESWPRLQTEDKTIKRELKKLEDPRLKNEGTSKIIGAFCRAYTIEDAIETFLADVYVPGINGRYTYKNGSTANGVVCYGHIHAYSHHNTDPAARRACNAFDLVRIHKFGHLDKDKAAEDPTRLKSYKAMCEFANNDAKVKIALLQGIADDFSEIDINDPGTDWRTKLEFTGGKDNKLKPTTNNLKLILENDPELKGRFWLNGLSLYVECANVAWRMEQHQWGDIDDSHLRCYLETHYGLYSKERLNDAFNAVAMANRRHPVKDYLNGLHWDQTPRLDTFIIRLIGAQDTQLNRALTRKHFTAAVARIMEPGCKYDTCLTLTGPEESGKSSLFRIMGGDWFDDSITTIEGKEGRESLRGKWIIELAELSGIKRSEVASVKNFLSNQTDCYRAAYDRRVTPYPRQCVFCATTNEDRFLKGDTGNRRFWVIQILPGLATGGTLRDRLTRLAEERDQLWAEALYCYRNGEKLYLDETQSAKLRETQENFSDEADSPYKAALEQFLYMKLPPDWSTYNIAERYRYINNPDELEALGTVDRERFCVAEFMCEKLGIKISDKNYKYEARKINRLMGLFRDWVPMSSSNHVKNLYGTQRAYMRIFADNDDDDL